MRTSHVHKNRHRGRTAGVRRPSRVRRLLKLRRAWRSKNV